MRYIYFFILISTLFCNTLFAQENSFSIEQWDNIVDYTNTKVTLAYIDDLHKTSNPNEEEIIYFKNILKPQLSKSNIESPISFDSLSSLMKPHFEKTLSNLSSQINEIKKGAKELDSWYKSIEATLKTVKKENLVSSEPINNLRAEITDYVNSFKIEKITEDTSVNVVSDEIIQERRESVLSLSNIIIFILLSLLIFLIIRLVKKGKKIEDFKVDIKKIEEENNWSVNKENKLINEVVQLKEKNQKLNNEVTRLIEELRTFKISEKRTFQKEPFENESNLNKSWDNPKPIPVLSSFYVGKPTPNREFTKSTQEIIEQETVFKLTYIDETKTSANFEVILASDFMKKQMINSPDDFLYRVCNNVNSNQEFQRDIITERKGVAHLRDGVWIIDENDKALIKFQ